MFNSGELQVILISLKTAALGTILIIPLSLSISWFLARSSMKGKLVVDTLVSFPLVLPPVVTGYALLLLLGRSGPVGGLLYSLFGIDVVFTWVAAALAAGLVSLPLMIRAMEVSIAGVDQRLEQVSRSLGAGPWRTFFNVTVPLAHRGILAGILLAFARGLGEFGATMVVAGNIPGSTQTLPLAIFTSLQTNDDAAALRLILISMALALVALILHRKLVTKKTL